MQKSGDINDFGIIEIGNFPTGVIVTPAEQLLKVLEQIICVYKDYYGEEVESGYIPLSNAVVAADKLVKQFRRGYDE